MDISVIIPSYKPQAYLWECLDSLYNQTLSKDKFEVLLVLNGCNEPYTEQILNWKKSHIDICLNLIQVAEGGVSNARNIGLDNAKGEYITFIDDDDYVSASYLEELLLKSDKKTVALSNLKAFCEDSKYNQTYFLEKAFIHGTKLGKQPFYLARKYFSGPVYKLIHRDIIGDRRFDPKMTNGEDAVFMFLISDRLSDVDFTSPNAIYFRRFRAGQATATGHRFSKRIDTSMRQLSHYNKIFWSNIGVYNIHFFITRVIGALRNILQG